MGNRLNQYNQMQSRRQIKHIIAIPCMTFYKQTLDFNCLPSDGLQWALKAGHGRHIQPPSSLALPSKQTCHLPENSWTNENQEPMPQKSNPFVNLWWCHGVYCQHAQPASSACHQSTAAHWQCPLLHAAACCSTPWLCCSAMVHHSTIHASHNVPQHATVERKRMYCTWYTIGRATGDLDMLAAGAIAPLKAGNDLPREMTCPGE